MINFLKLFVNFMVRNQNCYKYIIEGVMGPKEKTSRDLAVTMIVLGVTMSKALYFLCGVLCESMGKFFSALLYLLN